MKQFNDAFKKMYDFLGDKLAGNAAVILLICLGASLLIFAAVLIVFAVRRKKTRRIRAYAFSVFFGTFGVTAVCFALTLISEADVGSVVGVNTLFTAALSAILSVIAVWAMRVNDAPLPRPALPLCPATETDTVYARRNEALPPETEDLIAEIDRISLEGAPLGKMKEVAELLQKERLKPDNQGSAAEQQLSAALNKLLKSMDSAINA